MATPSIIPHHAGPAGAAEYQDVVAGAKFLQALERRRSRRSIGIWGGSYGGYLTAMGLARNSDIFKAGVDMHGVHDWSRFMDDMVRQARRRATRRATWKQAMKVGLRLLARSPAWTRWTSPVLLIQGDDDRNVHFVQMIDLANRLKAHHMPFEQIVIPNEIHGFLRWHSWLEADTATAAYLKRKLPVK